MPTTIDGVTLETVEDWRRLGEGHHGVDIQPATGNNGTDYGPSHEEAIRQGMRSGNQRPRVRLTAGC